ncbi:MAG: type III-B CRISPR-associated protein Cas10/Cmr2 [Thermoanaerobacteraceae bacterium]|nr:type III-B CRISPR-associated protein Cas10/Cmr2 [Thermoanaerobacteraceae bacterium]
MKEYLFLFTITPVQGFIEHSRKTQDLYAGSALLTHLCREAAMIVQKDWRGEIIFPNIKLRSLPNRFLAMVKEENDSVLKKKGFALEAKLYEKLREILDYFLRFYGLSEPPQAWPQIKYYFQFYWLFEPVEKGYAETYKKIENHLGQIKTRIFSPFKEERGRKCTLTGEHNALFYKKSDESHKPRYLVEGAIEIDERIPVKYLAPGEALGAVAFLKRIVPKYFEDHGLESSAFGSSFPSTARIASAVKLNMLSKIYPELAELLKKKFNEVLLYELLNDNKPTEYETEDELEIAKKICEVLKKNKERLGPYYAVIIFDGDNMGTWLSGEKLKEDQKGKLRDFHQHLSSELAKFAYKAADKILVPIKGATVYAGGDDFLGFVNINYLPSILKELREEFEKIDLTKFSSEKLTFSMGVAISHYKTPLSETLQWARRMEKEAKEVAYKDALSIVVLKRSGEIIKFRTKHRNSLGWFADQLQFLLDQLAYNFSTNFLRQFSREFIEFEGIMELENLDGMVESELGRLLTRSYIKDSSQTPSEKVETQLRNIAEMKSVLYNLYMEGNLKEFLGLLEVLSFLGREVEIDVVKN